MNIINNNIEEMAVVHCFQYIYWSGSSLLFDIIKFIGWICYSCSIDNRKNSTICSSFLFLTICHFRNVSWEMCSDYFHSFWAHSWGKNPVIITQWMSNLLSAQYSCSLYWIRGDCSPCIFANLFFNKVLAH